MRMDRIDVDVAVIGAGGAGARAAIDAARTGVSTLLIDKGLFGRSGATVMGAFSVAAAFGHQDPRDNPGVHYEDTIHAGRDLGEPDLVRMFTEQAPDRVRELASEGVRFARDGDRFLQAPLDGHTYPRACYVNYFHTGRGMMLGLARKAIKTAGVRVLDNCIVVNLARSHGQVWGAIAWDLQRAQPVLIRASATIIATGGTGGLYERMTVAAENTGDGLSLALEAGAVLRDIEFIQFYPTVTLYPRLIGWDPTAPATLRLQAEARIYNSRGEDFVAQVMPNWRLGATRDVLARLIYDEIINGSPSPHGGVYIDVSHLPPGQIEQELGVDNFHSRLLSQGIDLRRGPIEITVAAHYGMGGIAIDTDGFAGVPGLYAAGEAIAGIHGANRLAGNALSEILVTGSQAGIAAARAAKKTEARPEHAALISPHLDRLAVIAGHAGTDQSPAELKAQLRRTMWECVGVTRSEFALRRAETLLARIASFARIAGGGSLPYDRRLIDAVETWHMAVTARAVARSALYRTESRGAHFRSDFPATDPDWRVHTDVTAQDNEPPTVRHTPIGGGVGL